MIFMKMTIREILDKLDDIGRAIDAVEREIDKDAFRGQEPLSDAIELLQEYADVIKNTKVEI